MKTTRNQLEGILFFAQSVFQVDNVRITLEKVIENGHHNGFIKEGFSFDNLEEYLLQLKKKNFTGIEYGHEIKVWKEKLENLLSKLPEIRKIA
jgi:hypothetical protein